MRRLAWIVLACAAALGGRAHAQSLRGDVLYRVTLLRAAPGRLPDLVSTLKASVAAAGSRSLLLRHSQGDHWDVMLLTPLESYAAALRDRPAPLAPEALVAWQEDVFVRGPDLDGVEGFRAAGLYHAEMFHAAGDKRAALLKEREMENAYLRALGRPTNAIFVREMGASWEAFTLGAYKSWKHYAERDDIPKEKSAAAAKAAGFASEDEIGPYLRSLILDHHDSLLAPVR